MFRFVFFCALLAVTLACYWQCSDKDDEFKKTLYCGMTYVGNFRVDGLAVNDLGFGSSFHVTSTDIYKNGNDFFYDDSSKQAIQMIITLPESGATCQIHLEIGQEYFLSVRLHHESFSPLEYTRAVKCDQMSYNDFDRLIRGPNYRCEH
ncbi:hypothetical protein L596_021998 [Steinernema carpocapsae]|uniref:NTR domain-containing protein n=1 Tax=Steinernema carpocapsae TaxID=34508 RepID=A0A4U5MKI0_STECR|nr:hypothetical protein L596_021998 [Steinernema carpocapsae]